VKSPVASLCLICSSVRNRVRVTMFVFIFSITGGGVTSPFPFQDAMIGEEQFWERASEKIMEGKREVRSLVTVKRVTIRFAFVLAEPRKLDTEAFRLIPPTQDAVSCFRVQVPRTPSGVGLQLKSQRGGGNALAE